MVMDEIEISVVIPLYNKEHTIGRCITSVLNQTQEVNEIIIINDGSTDRSREELLLLLQEYKTYNIRFFEQKNRGVSFARNRGVEESKCRYIAFLDADDEWDSHYIEKMSMLIKDFPAAEIYSSFHRVRDDRGVQIIPHTDLPTSFTGYITDYFVRSRTAPLINSSKVIISKDVVADIGGFPVESGLTEDLYVWFVILLKYRFAHINEVLVTINQNEDDSRTNRFYDYPYIIKHYYRNRESFRMLSSECKRYLLSVFSKQLIAAKLSGNLFYSLRFFLIGLGLFGFRAVYTFPVLVVPRIILVKLREFRRNRLSK